MKILFTVIAAIVGYLLGMLPTGLLVARAMGNIDIRKTGSGNTGTTNVLRTLGWLPSLLTLGGDMLKGVIAALIGKLLGGETGMLAAGFCAVLGHNFPATMGFKGGKGIATSGGVTLIVCPLAVPVLVVITLGLAAATKIMSIGSICAAVAYPFLLFLLHPNGAHLSEYIPFAIVMAVLAIFQHRANIVRLIEGRENVLDFKKINEISKNRKKHA